MPHFSVRAPGNQDPYLQAWTMRAVWLDQIECRGWVTAYHWHEVTRIMQCFKLVIKDDDTRSFIVANLVVLGAPYLPNPGISIFPARIDVL